VPISACFKITVICSTENRFFFTTKPPPLGGLICRRTHILAGPDFRGPVIRTEAETELRDALRFGAGSKQLLQMLKNNATANAGSIFLRDSQVQYDAKSL
jgi:hypothetical protein